MSSLLLALVLLVAAAGFALAANRAEKNADRVGAGVTICPAAPLSATDVQALFAREDEMPFTVWGELPDMRISDPDLGRSTKADVLILRGASDRLLSQTAVLSSDDAKGCLLGERTAWELFGSTEIAGDEICIGSETRKIRGVVSQPQRGVLITGSLEGIVEDAKHLTCYDRITLASDKAADGALFLMQHGLEGRVVRFDYLRSLSWLQELIPGKWSDFSGWKANCKGKQQDFEAMMQMHKNCIELAYENQCMALIKNRVLEVVCVWMAVVYLFRALEGVYRKCRRRVSDMIFNGVK